MMNTHKSKLRIVISGSPGSGKTSIINLLNSKNIPTISEAAREEIIFQQQQKASNLFPWDNVAGFSLKVKDRILNNNGDLPIAFTDRGIPDIISYLKLANIHDRKPYLEAIQEINYHNTVFITPPWQDIYETDAQRKEDFKDADILHKLLVETYEELGFSVALFPKESVENRVTWLLNQCGNLLDGY